MSSPARVKNALRRSACDPCRAKRVRCLRDQDSTAPCARCSYLGSACVTGASGQPGRPPKCRRKSPVEGEPGQPPTPIPAPAPVRTTVTTPSPVQPPSPAPRHRVQEPPQSAPVVTDDEAWAALALSDNAAFFGPFVDQGLGDPTPYDNQQQCNPLSPLQMQPMLPQPLQVGLLRGDDDFNMTPDLATNSSNSSTAFDMDMDMLLDGEHDYGRGVLSPAASSSHRPRSQKCSVEQSLVALREEIEQHIVAVHAYYKDATAVQQWCMDETGQGSPGPNVPEHPPAAILTCSQKLGAILQTLVSSQTNPISSLTGVKGKSVGTETLLVALSTYLALMRLCDILFHQVRLTLSKLALLPPVPYEALKVKSVLRIGGVSTLQDMPLKAYAAGILEAIYGQMRTVERCLGVPTKHCLHPSGDDVAAPPTGLFSRKDRAQLFETVMAQEDVEARRGGNSYVESIRANIEQAMSFFNNM